MTNKHMQIKNTKRYHYVTIRIVKIITLIMIYLTILSVNKDTGQLSLSQITGWNAKLYSHFE